MIHENMNIHTVKDFFEELERLWKGVTGRILVLQNEGLFFYRWSCYFSNFWAFKNIVMIC